MKRRYFLKDPKGKYRGLFSITEEHAERLRRKGWTYLRAGTPFRKVRPWIQNREGERENG